MIDDGDQIINNLVGEINTQPLDLTKKCLSPQVHGKNVRILNMIEDYVHSREKKKKVKVVKK